MSVVVYDTFDLVGDRYMGQGSVLALCPKVGKNELFAYGFVGSPHFGQMIVSNFYEDFKVDRVKAVAQHNKRMLELPAQNEWDGTEVLIIPHEKREGSILCLAVRMPALILPDQPLYLGAADGQGIYNYCKALNDNKPFARECVGMCITSSTVSNAPFAVGPSDVVSVSPYGAA